MKKLLLAAAKIGSRYKDSAQHRPKSPPHFPKSPIPYQNPGHVTIKVVLKFTCELGARFPVFAASMQLDRANTRLGNHVPPSFISIHVRTILRIYTLQTSPGSQ